MTTIKIAEIINSEYAISPKDGQKVYEMLHPLLQSGDAVEVDFSGIRIVVSTFLSFAIGHLVKDCDISNLKLIGLNPSQQETVDLVLQNAKNYYANNVSNC